MLWSSDAGGRGVLVAGTAAPGRGRAVGLDPRATGTATSARPMRPAPESWCRSSRARSAIEAADQSVTLDAGDAVSFPGDVAHSYVNCREATCSILVAVIEPRVDAARPEVVDG